MKRILLFFSAIILLLPALNSCKENNLQDGTLSPYISIYDVRKLFKGEEVSLNTINMKGANLVRGLVISDTQSDNNIPGTIIIQGYKIGKIRGIILDFQAPVNDVSIGDSIMVDLQNSILKKVNGSLMISNLNANKITKITSDNIINPQLITTSQLIAGAKDYESTLVQILSNTYTAPVKDEDTFSGDRVFYDGTGDVTLHTESTAEFAHHNLPASATFTGLPLFYNSSPEGNEVIRLWPRAATDITDASGPLYPKFPENFEGAVKTTATPADVTFQTGVWYMHEALLGTNAPFDRMNPDGLKSVRFSQNLSVPALLQMKFDAPDGASKVTFLYGSTATDVPCTFRLEYSIDQGTTWLAMGNDIFCDYRGTKIATYTMDIDVPVRFRIYKLGLGPSGVNVYNGRFNIDDFAIYKGLN